MKLLPEKVQELGDVQAQLVTSSTHVLSPDVPNWSVSPAQNFVKGELIANVDGATYEGIVYDRWLTLRLPDGREWCIFDDALRNEFLPINEMYELVISPYIAKAWLAEALDPTGESETAAQPNHWQGVVVDPEWQAPSGAFRIACEELYQQKWFLVATSFGNVILEPEDIEAEVKAGSVIQWIGTRPDLYAVV